MNEYNLSEGEIKEMISLSMDKAVLARDEFWKETIKEFYKNNTNADVDSSYDKGFSDCNKKWRYNINKLMKTPNYQLAGGYEADENYNKALGDLITLMK